MKKQWMALLLALVLALAPCCTAVAEEEEAEAPALYALGDVMEDFTAVLTDGTEVSLSGLLAEKKAVLINFWATWCGPCEMEFPFMEEAYNQMSDDIAVVALSIEGEDTFEVIEQFKEEVGLTTLPMGRDENQMYERFDSEGIPTSVMVDRNGVICWIEIGSITSTTLFLNLFKVYADPEYTEPVLLEGVPGNKPTVEPASSDELSAALNAEGGELVFAHAGNEYTWPFVVTEDGVTATNMGEVSTTCRVDVTLTAEAGQALAYEYKGNVAAAMDCLYVLVNGEVKACFSGEAADWAPGCVTFDEAGETTVSFRYMKSGYEMELEGEELSLRNVRLTSAEEALALMPQLPRALEGRELGYELLTEGARNAVISILGDYAFDNDIVVANGNSLDIRVLIGEELDPYAAYVNVNETAFMLNAMPHDETGYLLHVDIPEEEDAELPYLYIVADAFSEAYEYMPLIVYANEAQVEATMDLYEAIFAEIEYDNTCEWRYIEGNRVVQAPMEEYAEEYEADEEICQYVAVVKDGEGNPVEGVAVQFCDDMSCIVVNTDATGTAVFESEAYPYEVHILKVPEGFAAVEEAFTLDAAGETLEVTLTKAE